MRQRTCFFVVIVLSLLVHPMAAGAQTIAANDNRLPAGDLQNRVVTIRLEIGEGLWHPESENGEAVRIYAFGERGKTLQAPGPLIRVPQGTEVRASVHNRLPVAAAVRGLYQRPADGGTVLTVAPGATEQVTFQAGAPGTYYYWATTTGSRTMATWMPIEGELAGAFVVDPPGAVVNDRVLVLSRRIGPVGSGRRGAINGKSWPYDEQLTFNVGDTVHWRVLNLDSSAHGMHLHGFYFHVDATGDGNRVQPFRETEPPIVVTTRVDAGGTFDMTWVAEHPGRWLFHCHMIIHMNAPPPPLGAAPTPAPAHAHGGEPESAGMSGLVLGFTILPKPGSTQAPDWKAQRKLQLVLEEQDGRRPAFRVEVRDPVQPPPPPEFPSLWPVMGPAIVLTQGVPVEIEVVNHTKEATAIHWHGIELDSYYDGVPEWGGLGDRKSPAVLPGESFVARLQPTRSGSFIYHTHWHTPAQINNGVYGPLVVMPPGQAFNPATDKNFLFSRGILEPFGSLLLINGSPQAPALHLLTGTRYRFRLTNITPNEVNLRVSLLQAGRPVEWRIIAKDGADLPPAAAIMQRAELIVSVGETYDFEYEASTPGELALEIISASVLRRVSSRTTQTLIFTAPPR